MLRLPHWLGASAAIVIAVLGFLLWQQHREMTVLRVKLAKGAAAHG